MAVRNVQCVRQVQWAIVSCPTFLRLPFALIIVPSTYSYIIHHSNILMDCCCAMASAYLYFCTTTLSSFPINITLVLFLYHRYDYDAKLWMIIQRLKWNNRNSKCDNDIIFSTPHRPHYYHLGVLFTNGWASSQPFFTLLQDTYCIHILLYYKFNFKQYLNF